MIGTPTKQPSRIVALDLLRGSFLVAIIIDHLQRFPNLLDLITGRGYLWISAAEGFFFLSGLMLAMVRRRDALEGSWRPIIKKTYARAAKLYLWSVGLTVAFTYIAFAVGEDNPGLKSGLIGHDSFGHILLNAASFRYVYGWADFLPHYVIFLLGAPLVLWLLTKKRTDVVLAISVLAWLLTSSFTGRWQILFYGGMVVGYHREAILAAFQRLSERTRRRIIGTTLTTGGLLMAASLLVVRYRDEVVRLVPSLGDRLAQINDLTAPYFDKMTLPLPRLLLFTVWFGSLFIIFRHYESAINRYLGWLLRPLGKNSLLVYIAHSIVLFAVGLLIPFATHGLIVNILISVSVIGTIWLIVHRPPLRRTAQHLPSTARAALTVQTIATAGILAYDALSRFVR